MEKILEEIETTSYYSKRPVLVGTLPEPLADIVGDGKIYISEFVVAKVMGKIQGVNSHPEITREILLRVTDVLHCPLEIIQDLRGDRKYLFIGEGPLHQIVIEIKREESGKSEINTIFKINLQELKRLEHKFPVVYSVGGTPTSSSSHSQQGRFSGVN